MVPVNVMAWQRTYTGQVDVSQVQNDRPRTTGKPSGQERAARVWQLVADGARIPSVQASRWKRRRDRAAQPSSLARVLDDIRELPTLGVTKASALRIPLVCAQAVEDAFGLCVTVTTDTLMREIELEHAENMAALRIAQGDRSPAALEAYAEALEAEAHHQLELARAARAEAAETRRGA